MWNIFCLSGLFTIESDALSYISLLMLVGWLAAVGSMRANGLKAVRLCDRPQGEKLAEQSSLALLFVTMHSDCSSPRTGLLQLHCCSSHLLCRKIHPLTLGYGSCWIINLLNSDKMSTDRRASTKILKLCSWKADINNVDCDSVCQCILENLDARH